LINLGNKYNHQLSKRKKIHGNLVRTILIRGPHIQIVLVIAWSYKSFPWGYRASGKSIL